MTIHETQELIEAWVAKHNSRHKSELTNMAILTEEVGELARVIAQKHSDPAAAPDQMRAAMANELSDVMWALICIANQSDIDMTQALIDNLEKKNKLSPSKR